MTDTTTKPFDPTEHGFVYLPEHQPASEIRFYEYRNHHRADGFHDYYRSNVYLSQDGEFVTIWDGVLESFGNRMMLRSFGQDSSRPRKVVFMEVFQSRSFGHEISATG